MDKKFNEGDSVTFKCAGSAVEESGTVLSYMKNGDVCVLNNGMRIGLKEDDIICKKSDEENSGTKDDGNSDSGKTPKKRGKNKKE